MYKWNTSYAQVLESESVGICNCLFGIDIPLEFFRFSKCMRIMMKVNNTKINRSVNIIWPGMRFYVIFIYTKNVDEIQKKEEKNTLSTEKFLFYKREFSWIVMQAWPNLNI